jgi:hypothetical protein
MYEKSIARHNFIYYVTAPVSLTLVKDLLEPADYTELYTILNAPGKERIVVDGYLKCDGVMYVAHKADGAEEVLSASERYPLPIANWQEQVWIRGVGTILVRLVTS